MKGILLALYLDGFFTWIWCVLAGSLIAAKLAHAVACSWWWVLAPLWVPLTFCALVFGVLTAFAGRWWA